MCGRRAGLLCFNIFNAILLLLGHAQFMSGCVLWYLHYDRFSSDEISTTVLNMVTGSLCIFGFYFGKYTTNYTFRPRKTRREVFRQFGLFLLLPMVLCFITALISALPAFVPEMSGKRSLPFHRRGAMWARPTKKRLMYFRLLVACVVMAVFGLAFITLFSFYTCCYSNGREIAKADAILAQTPKVLLSSKYSAKVSGKYASAKSIHQLL